MRRIREEPTHQRVVATGVISAAVLVALACSLTLGVSRASAGQVSCGDTITADTTLHQDLVNCPNNGILIGADNITLDLNGHTIDGDGTPAAGCDPETDFCDIGVANFGHDGVTVKHGSMRAVRRRRRHFGEVRHNRLLDISASGTGSLASALQLLPKSWSETAPGIARPPRGHRVGRLSTRTTSGSCTAPSGTTPTSESKPVGSTEQPDQGEPAGAQRRRGHAHGGTASAFGSSTTGWFETARGITLGPGSR